MFSVIHVIPFCGLFYPEPEKSDFGYCSGSGELTSLDCALGLKLGSTNIGYMSQYTSLKI